MIMIDDGSEDNSRDICEEIRETDCRIRILIQEHKGASAARNAGIKAANGKYVFFLDSDDMIHPELLETFYELMEKSGAVIAMGNYCREIEGIHSKPESGINKDIDFDDAVVEENCFDTTISEYMYLKNQQMMQEFLKRGAGGIGGKMIRYTFLQFREFDQNLVVGEDTKLIYQLVADGADAVILYRNWYYYRKHKGNTSKKYDVESIRSIYECIRYICDKEIEYSRIDNAVLYEEYIITSILEWKIINRQMQDQAIAKYLKELMYNERKLYAFSKVKWCKKKDFFCMLYSYPLFVLERNISNIWNGKKNILLNKKNTKASWVIEEKVWTNKEKVSVIIPMYNSEAYISRCIQSVINQSYSNLEIIIIDDGSTDGGLELCKKLCLTDERIRIFSQDNKGVAKARNMGIDIAAGKYIFFLDSADAIHPLLLEELVWQVEDKHADIALCDYTMWTENVLEKLSDTDVRPQWRIIEGVESAEWFHKEYYTSMMRVGILICKESVGILRFDNNLVYGREALFLYSLIYKQLRIAYSTQEWYYHQLYPNQEESLFESIKDEGYFDIYRILRDKEYQRDYLVYALLWERRLVWNIRKKYTLSREKKNEEYSEILKNQAVAEMKNPLFRRLVITARILFYCCFFFYPLYSILRRFVSLLDKIIWFIKWQVCFVKGKLRKTKNR